MKQSTILSFLILSLVLFAQTSSNSLKFNTNTKDNYNASCQRPNLNGNTLSATCRRMNGKWNRTSLNLASCITGINGGDGVTAVKCSLHNTFLSCKGRTRNGKSINRSMNLNTGISNINGVLRCP